jgi:nitrogen fixation protein FixH
MAKFTFHWGHGIALFMTFFISMSLFQLWKSTQYSFPLVKQDYYQDDINLGEILIQKNNALDKKCQLYVLGDSVYIYMPSMSDISGELSLLRPHDNKQDVKMPLETLINGKVVIPIHALDKGRWMAKASWTDGTQSYLIEQSIVL